MIPSDGVEETAKRTGNMGSVRCSPQPAAVQMVRGDASGAVVSTTVSELHDVSTDLLADYVGGDVLRDDGVRRRSSFAAALGDACKASGRDPATGEVVVPEASESWLAAVAWLCFFEQVGNAVKLTNLHPAQATRFAPPRFKGAERAFRGALVQFARGVGDDQMSMLWALRCSLAHDYRLVHTPRDPARQDLAHRFMLFSAAEEQRLAWRGASAEPVTRVNLWRLSDVGVEVADAVRNAHDAGQLAMVPDDPVVFAERYFMGVAPLDAVQSVEIVLSTTSSPVTGAPGVV
jgi:hypothetical protein